MQDLETSSVIREKAPLILAEIKKAKSILLHCHPSPDPDSVCSALAMKFVLEQMGKKATVIKGDSVIPEAFMHFPGASEIVMKNFWEIDLAEFDLFVVLDGASPSRISSLRPLEFPLSIPFLNIDHHRSAQPFSGVDLIEPTYPATAQILYELFVLWGVKFDRNIAANLFMGMYTDTGGFKYKDTSSRTFIDVSALVAFVPDFPEIVSTMENSNTIGDLAYQGAALSSLQFECGGKVLLSVVSHQVIQDRNIPLASISAGSISSILRSAGRHHPIAVALIEPLPSKVKASFRSCGPESYDVSKLATAFGGGGHKMAAGASIDLPIAEARDAVVSKIKELYNL